jgi:hypothetical protein
MCIERRGCPFPAIHKTDVGGRDSNAPVNALLFAPADVTLPLPTAHPLLAKVHERVANEHLQRLDPMPSRFLRCSKIHRAGFSEKRPWRVLPTLRKCDLVRSAGEERRPLRNPWTGGIGAAD